MATLVAHRPGAGIRCKKAAALLGAVLLAAIALAAPAQAVTRGGRSTGAGVLSALGIAPPMNTGNPPTPVEFRDTRFGFIYNEYIAVVYGDSDSSNWTWNLGQNTTLTYNPPGRLAFGNTGGSLRSPADDRQGLSSPFSYLFPLPGRVTVGNSEPGYSGFVALNIDPPAPNQIGTNVSLGFASGDWIRRSEIINGALVQETQAGTNIVVRQSIRLRRSTARLEWTIRNIDQVNAHAVGLQFVVNQDTDLFVVNPQSGATNRPVLYTGGNIPATLDLPETRVNPTRFGRFTLRGFDATLPNRVFITDERTYRAENYQIPNPTQYESPFALATGVYWDPVSIPPGGTRTIVTYFGNGSANEDLAADFVSGVEGVEALQFNSAAAATLTDEQKTGATLGTGGAFLAPQTFQIFGGVYNQTAQASPQGEPDPEREVVLNNVAMSLTLPRGLVFAPGETSTKVVGTLRGDAEGRAMWNVVATGETYGALTYQLAVSAPPVGSRTISRVINIPATPLRTFSNADWDLVSFPFTFDPTLSNQGDPSTILNAITRPVDNPGGVVPIFRYDPASSAGGGNPYPRVTQIGPGVGYFYRPSLTRTVLLAGAVPIPEQAPPSGELGTPYQITLERGWNMIGNPYVYEIPLAYLRIVPLENNPSLRSFTFSEAVTAGFVRGALFYYNGQAGGGRYEFLQNLSDPLRPWVGYWLFVNSRVTLVYATPTSINSAVLGATPVSPPATSPITPPPAPSSRTR